MFKALDRVQYDALQLNKPKDDGKTKPRQVKPLVDLASVALNWHSDLDKLISILPVHLLPRLLHSAILNDQVYAIWDIVAGWPLHTLRFKDVIQDEHDEMFEEKIGYACRYLILGLSHRTKNCKLRCIDFQGVRLEKHQSSLISTTWPLQSLKKSQLKLKSLSKEIIKTAGGADDFHDLLINILKRKLRQIGLDSKIVIPKGQRLEVKLDSVFIATSYASGPEYLITNCLRNITPLYITVKNIYITSDVEGNCVSDLLPPLLKQQDSEILYGLSMRQLEEGIFYMLAKDVQNFTNLHSLELHNCGIYLREGVTRSRTLARSHLSQTFSCFKHLRRLDLSFNYLLGCLGEMLEALASPLEYLSLRGCDLNENDLQCLAQSRHSSHLRELNISKLCQFSNIYENDPISNGYLMPMMQHFPQLTVLNLSQNLLPDSGITEFCGILSNHLTQLKGLDIAGNFLQFENQLNVTRACAKNPRMQWIRFSCMSNLIVPNPNVLNMEDTMSGFKNLLVKLGREDISVNVVRLSLAILVDLINVFD